MDQLECQEGAEWSSWSPNPCLAFRKQHLNSHCLYLLLLAFFDFFVAVAYVPLMSISLLADYLESPLLLNAWYVYMRPMITVSHIAMTASSFLILAASFERYCITCFPGRLRGVQRRRRHIAALAILAGVVTKITLYYEFDVSPGGMTILLFIKLLGKLNIYKNFKNK